MTEKQAIAEFKDRLRISAMNKYADMIPEYIEAMQLAISALEKQTPRTVRTQFDRRHNYFLHFCPICGGLVREYEYCSDCGQKLSYEEDTENDRDTCM